MVVGESLFNEVTAEAVPRGDEGEVAIGGRPFQAGGSRTELPSGE